MKKPSLNVLGRNRQQCSFKGLDQIWKGTGLKLAQLRLDLPMSPARLGRGGPVRRPRQFNRIEIRRVWRQIDQVRATRLDQGFNPGYLVRRKIIHEQDVTTDEGRHDALLDVAIEDVAINGSRQNQRGSNACCTNYGQRRGVRARRQRSALNHALIGSGASIQSRQAQIDARFIEKLEVCNLQRGYGFLEFRPLLLDFGRVTLAGMKRLFFNGSFSRANSRHIRLASDWILHFWATRVHNSCKVASGCSLTAARISASAAANARGTPPA